jgi:hypothetical protein
MGMRKCYAAALLLISWFVMLPPPVYPPSMDSSGHYKMNTTVPPSQWLKFKTVDSEAACKAELKHLQPFYRCFRSDDPALKKSTAAAKPAPSASTMSVAPGTHTN